MISLIFYLLILTQLCCVSCGTVKFTNLRCENFDKSSITIRKCMLKAIGRNKVTLNLHMGLLKVPADNITAHAQLLRKGSFYRPYLYSSEVDVCKAVAMKETRAFDFWQLLYNTFRPYTNLNHTCPFNHDVIFKDYVLNYDSRFFRMLPFPSGDYQVRYNLSFSKRLKFGIKLNINIME